MARYAIARAVRAAPSILVPSQRDPVQNATLDRLKRNIDLCRSNPVEAEEARLSLLANDRNLLRERLAGDAFVDMPPWLELAPEFMHSGFETAEACEAEDAHRFQAAMREGHHELAQALVPRHGPPEPSHVSARFGRLLRLRLIAAARRLFIGRRCYFLTVIPPNWWVPVDQLPLVDPQTLLQGFKQQVARAGGRVGGGLLFVRLEASLQVHPRTGQLGWQFHLHGVITEELRPVMRAMRKVRAFRTLDGIIQPIRGKTMCDEDISRVLGYSTKQKVNAGELAEVEHEGEIYRLNPRGRLPEPFHSEYLCWLHRRRPADLCLTVGSRNIRHSLRASWL